MSAYGTDIKAQKAAVKHNLQTIGCLAHGLNQIYPISAQKVCGRYCEFL
jgi:DNA processing protein